MLKAKRIKKQKRVRAKIRGSKDLPRISVYRSNKYIYAQAIDDLSEKTLESVSENEIKEGKTKTERAKLLGLLLAKKLIKGKKDKILFDRGSFRYHGRVKSFADGLREGGLKF